VIVLCYFIQLSTTFEQLSLGMRQFENGKANIGGKFYGLYQMIKMGHLIKQ